MFEVMIKFLKRKFFFFFS